MGQNGGPKLPLDGLKFLVDSRNVTSVDTSYVTDFISKISATITSTSLSGLGTTKGLLLSLAASVLSFANINSLSFNSLTISSWIFPLSFGIGNSQGRIFDKGTWAYPYYGYMLFVNNITATKAIHYACGNIITNTGGYLNNSVDLDTWQHFAVTHSGTTATFYKNGVSIGSSTNIFGATNISNMSGNIGNSALSDRAFDGKIASVRVYNRALSANEVSQLYTSTKSRYGL
jgi:hypothetical protein